ncbi:hypothetical protein HAX54_018498 [Datura stramonium]|uniref:Uncharacterized protein n=1 Tax=Datura stramonium TaxID=4076 RepID=A0ABS8UN70_DATST|nr:hypothetical protein [Datura stramonium]
MSTNAGHIVGWACSRSQRINIGTGSEGTEQCYKTKDAKSQRTCTSVNYQSVDEANGKNGSLLDESRTKGPIHKVMMKASMLSSDLANQFSSVLCNNTRIITSPPSPAPVVASTSSLFSFTGCSATTFTHTFF